MGIPHIIHLCWFGRSEYPPLVQMCINSWKENLPGYEIKLWNEDTFDVNSIPWTKEAYESKKWAFVSDYVRLYALKEYGGVYLDTDVEVLKDFSALLEGKSYVSSFVEKYLFASGFIASEHNNEFINKLLLYYVDKHFINDDGKIKDLMNPVIFTKLGMRYFGFDFGITEFFDEDKAIYNYQYLMPYKKNFFKEKTDRNSYHLTDYTYTIHHDMGSWKKRNALKQKLKAVLRLVLSEKIYLLFKKIKFQKMLASFDEFD